MGSCGICPVKNSQSTARLSANSAAEPAKISRTISELPQIERTIEPRETKFDIETMITAHQPSFNPGQNTEQTEITEQTELLEEIPFVPLFPFVPYSLFISLRVMTGRTFPACIFGTSAFAPDRLCARARSTGGKNLSILFWAGVRSDQLRSFRAVCSRSIPIAATAATHACQPPRPWECRKPCRARRLPSFARRPAVQPVLQESGGPRRCVFRSTAGWPPEWLSPCCGRM